MADEDELVRAILAAPDDDAPRLVYADLLQQRGDPRGELIALQCNPPPAEAAARAAHARREAELCRLHRAQWLGAWFPHARHHELARGFLTELSIGASHVARAIRGLAADAHELVHLRALDLTWDDTDHLGDADLEAIVAHPALANLERLEISAHGVRESSVALVARHLPNLAALVLDNQGIGDGAITALVAAPRPLARLRTLALRTQHLSPVVGAALATWPELAHIAELDFSSIDIHDSWCNALDDATVTALAASPHNGALTDLNLSDLPITDASTHALATCPRLTHLTSLGLGFTSISDASALALPTAAFTRSLTTLDLSFTNLTDAGAASLLQLPSLTSLDLSGTRITTTTLHALLDTPHTFTRLTLRGLDVSLPTALLEALTSRFPTALEV
ncbi:MAG: TIGR02996 domain-containing protein [Deltaproteobacteria bacterium]|nr:TIGR02996 domain-containing protein [Deltaproteobacteria bacterium]